jgi:hypothetical protein
MGEAYSINAGECDSIYIYIIDGKAKGKEPLGRPRHTMLDNIKMDLGEIGWRGIYFTGLYHDRSQWTLVIALISFGVP